MWLDEGKGAMELQNVGILLPITYLRLFQEHLFLISILKNEQNDK